MADEATEGGTGVRAHVAIALASCAVLLFEVLVTRVLSVVLWYHFVFLSVSLAMLGVGAPGVWFAFRPPGPRTVTRALLVAAVALPLSVFAISSVGPFFREATAFWVVVVLAPVLPLGAAVCALLLSARGRAIGWMYGADLLGATVGAALVFPLLYGLPTPHVVASLGLLAVVAAVVVDPGARKVAAVLAALVVATVAWGKPYRLRYTKSYVESVAPLFERWTPTARLAVFPSSFVLRDQGAAFGWGMGSKWQPQPLDQLWLEQDGSAGTPITRWDGTSPLPHLMFDVTSAAYQLQRPERVCIIGAGGGRDVLTAIKSGATHVDAVELNPFTIDVVSRDFRGYSGDPYHRANVRAVASEGRAFLTRSYGQYDVLQISLIDTWAATSAGAYALSENGLYTLEAFRLYLRRLSPNGVLTVSRWAAGARQLEITRLAVLARAALIAEGVADPNRHLAVVTAGEVGNLMAFRKELDATTLGEIDRVAAERGFARKWPLRPGERPGSMLQGAMLHGEAPLRAAGFDLAPPTDDRPYFFQTIDIRRPPDAKMLAGASANEHAVVHLRRLVAIVAALTVALFFLPFVARGRIRRAPGFGAGTVYFAAIGVAFMFVELPLIQRLAPWLGHPSRATTVVLTTMLLGAGVGSVLAGRMVGARARGFALALPAVAALLAIALPSVLEAGTGASLITRVFLAVLVVSPVAVAMGFAFPSGMIAFGEENRPWMWAVNGAASVLASVSSLALSMAFGFTRVLWLGAACYAVAALVLARRAERVATSS
ncbi:MAG: hypothetical protein HYV09_03640 [Deltaproteobacteria bacterium]|nr:hypothetical protein [Deltaproteobacteria bacterium]